MPKITTFLTFDHQAEDAANFYTSVFKDSKIVSTAHYGDAGPGPKGSLMTATISLAGQELMLLNGGPTFKFSQASRCSSAARPRPRWTTTGPS